MVPACSVQKLEEPPEAPSQLNLQTTSDGLQPNSISANFAIRFPPTLPQEVKSNLHCLFLG